MDLKDVGILPQNYMTSQPRRPQLESNFRDCAQHQVPIAAMNHVTRYDVH
jgi:hypothetical protein